MSRNTGRLVESTRLREAFAQMAKDQEADHADFIKRRTQAWTRIPRNVTSKSPAAMSRFYSYDDKIKCLKREIAMRERVYPKWVESDRMSLEKMEWEIECMEAILNDVLANMRTEEIK